MSRQAYSYAASVKSDASDELINRFLIRPLAGLVVRLLYYSPVSPNQVSIASTLAGIAAAAFFFSGGERFTPIAGLFITLKDILDSADGQLARAKQQYSRRGRFIDSIGDILVNIVVFTAFGVALHAQTGNPVWPVLGMLAFVGTTLRVSYHVYYQTSFLHLQNAYSMNRVTEEIRPDDLKADKLTLALQLLFQLLYGWQDRLMLRLDAWCRKGISLDTRTAGIWYGNRTGLRWSGVMGLGTELFLLAVFSLLNNLQTYLVVNIALLNLGWLGSVLYRRLVLADRL